MKKNILLTALLLAVLHPTFAAKKGKPTLLVGFYGGVNFTQPASLYSYSVNNVLGSTSDITPKNYHGMLSNRGNQFGFAMFYPAFGNLHIGLLPSYSSYKYAYTTERSWTEETGSTLNDETEHIQKLRYFEIPLSVRYYVGTTKLKPFVEGIVSYGMMHTADKTANSEFTRDNGATASVVQSTSIKSDYSDNFITSRFDLGVGAGVSYDFNQIILMLGASYYININNVTDEENRYSNDLFVGNAYDVQDDLNLHALKVNLSVIFPISKITKRSDIECNYFREQRDRKKR
ncbi:MULTISPECIES: outer membrane beta-barrel protein [unclassified Saccharicrinis]|uniref:outer membrane beta-barrel protein n=1 Tax=unclassified Saccharicrinis TaxID=2646859 RepID=UPI003D344081